MHRYVYKPARPEFRICLKLWGSMDRISPPYSYFMFACFLASILRSWLSAFYLWRALLQHKGMIPNAKSSLPSFFPNMLFYFDSPWMISAFLLLWQQSSCICLWLAENLRYQFPWYGLASCNRNVLIRNRECLCCWVSIATALIPRVSLQQKSREWEFPRFYSPCMGTHGFGYSLAESTSVDRAAGWKCFASIIENHYQEPTLFTDYF